MTGGPPAKKPKTCCNSAVVGPVVDREGAVEGQGLAAVANLVFKKGFHNLAGRGRRGATEYHCYEQLDDPP